LGPYSHSFTYFYTLPISHLYSYIRTDPNGDAVSIPCTYFNFNANPNRRSGDCNAITPIHGFSVRKADS
jgi:hypothetical protein